MAEIVVEPEFGTARRMQVWPLGLSPVAENEPSASTATPDATLS